MALSRRVPMTRGRSGMSLLEVLVALPLIAILGALAVSLVLQVQRRAFESDGVLGATRELRHAATVLSNELRVVRPSEIVAWRDTAIEFESVVGIATVCAIDPARSHLLVVAASKRTPTLDSTLDPIGAQWSQVPQDGDRVQFWRAGETMLDRLALTEATLRSVSVGTECGNSPLRASATGTTTRLQIDQVLTAAPTVGTPVRVTRRTRYSLYRATDGDWYIGRRTLGRGGWDVVQPVDGPMQSARAGGLILQAYDTTGAPLADGDSPVVARSIARLRIQLRAPRRAGRASPRTVRVDSLGIDVALRPTRGGV